MTGSRLAVLLQPTGYLDYRFASLGDNLNGAGDIETQVHRFADPQAGFDQPPDLVFPASRIASANRVVSRQHSLGPLRLQRSQRDGDQS